MLAMRIAFGFGIAILFPLIIHYGVSTFVPDPNWADYQIENYWEKHGNAMPEEKIQLETQQKQLENEYEKAQMNFTRILFFVGTPLGLLALIIGPFLRIQAIGSGLVFGGIIMLTDSYFWYWSQLQDWMRFISFLIAFSILIGLGYKKMSKA